MDETDKRKLTSNRSYLVKNIYKPMSVVDKLMEERIITDGMKQDIEAERTNDDRNRKLLDIIPRRGPKAFEEFLKALVRTDNEFSAEQISPGAGQKYREVMTSSQKGMVSPSEENHQFPPPVIALPTRWPTEQDCVTDFVVKECGDAAKVLWNSDTCYKMMGKPRGRVLLFNNFVIVDYKEKIDGEWKTKLQKREGTIKDEESLRRLFEQLHFDVEVKKDRKLNQMREDIKEEKDRPFHKTADCFILVFLSHGSSDGIYGIDGKVLPTAEVKSSFNNRNFSSMTNKPKLIFIQACRGDTYDSGANSADSVADAKQSFGALNLNVPEPETLDQPDSKVEKAPSDADMFVANATTQDYVSFRNMRYGSWFIQALVFVFRNYACQAELLHMLTLVNKLVSEGRALDSEKKIAVAVSEFNSTLRHQFYFFPGLTETAVHSPQN
ncbi:caspase-2-like [Mizuhopecten yessoensis]|uniref:Caspase-2 n=1 Tax=Mizuhopecten yessoensis TaxID=6573 RepID=A0A210QRZ2_MIZYE|nr:caspase-2-like [Mizuhopecten yessoensis]OWF51510.1 Caspase-2 [Mizuhopecten yessoensis]